MNGTYRAIADAGGSAGSRTVILVSTDAALRARLRSSLTSLRWQVREASGGAETIGAAGGEAGGGIDAGQLAAGP